MKPPESTTKVSMTKVVITIQSFDQNDRRIAEEKLEFTDEGLVALREIDEDPKKAVFLALQIAIKMKRFDESATGSYELSSQKMKGKFEIPEWR